MLSSEKGGVLPHIILMKPSLRGGEGGDLEGGVLLWDRKPEILNHIKEIFPCRKGSSLPHGFRRGGDIEGRALAMEGMSSILPHLKKWGRGPFPIYRGMEAVSLGGGGGALEEEMKPSPMGKRGRRWPRRRANVCHGEVSSASPSGRLRFS